MKKLLLSLCIVASASLMNNAKAQLSQGGTPFTFNNGFKSIQPVTFVIMPPFNLAEMQAEDAINDQNKGWYRFGFNHMVNLNLSNSGHWTALPNGDRLWQLGVKSNNAHSINLAFDDFYLPKGASLFVYNSTKDFVIGAFTSVNNQEDKQFATDLIQGEAVVIEYYEPANVANEGRISLFRVTHGYRGVEDYLKNFGDAGACQNNVNCPLGGNWQNEKRSVVCLVSGGSGFCSGALVNDVPHDGKPYILTANHCGSSGFGTWVFRFNWEAPGCSNPDSSPSTAQSLTGGTQRAFSANSDFSLVEITGGLSGGTIPPSYGTYFSGWNNVNTPADSVWGIHHPSGDIKKISKAANACTSNTWAGTPANSHWKVGQWTSGCTEGGSSGSPLYDQNHRIVGQLHGGPSACGVAASSMNDLYGKFSLSWLGGGTAATQLKAWLDPANTGATVLDGWGPTVGVADNKTSSDFNIYPNPTSGLFNIELSFAVQQNVKIKVFNLLGKVVSERTITNISNGVYSIDLTTEAAGLYFVEMTTATQKTVKKINVVR